MTTNNLPAALQDLAGGLAATANANPVIQGGSSYLKFLQEGKEGTWVYGPDAVEPDPESKWVANPHSLRHGWVLWRDGANKPDKVLVPATQPLPSETDLPAPGPNDTLAEGRAVTLACIEGEDEGEQVEFETNSMGGRDAWAELLQLIYQRVRAGHADCYPVLELGYGQPYSTRGKVIRKPRFVLVGWTDEAGTPEAAKLEGPGGGEPEDEADPEAEVQPKRRRRRRTAA